MASTLSDPDQLTRQQQDIIVVSGDADAVAIVDTAAITEAATNHATNSYTDLSAG